MVSSLQQQSPQQSPFLLCCLRKSFTNHGAKIVRKEKYSVITQIPAKMQKLLSPGKELSEPPKKAIASVIEVIVIEGPACLRPIMNLSFADKCFGV